MALVRFGTLGAARITPPALIRPARALPEPHVAAVAARDPERARRFAARHGVPTVHDTYDALVGDPDVDAVYVPLPNGLHGEWTIRALEAGKHVLCEKPFTANAEEAEQVAEVARRTGRVVVEAFHWRYHPLAERMIEIVRSGELGEIRQVEASLCIPLPLPGDIRYRWDLAGGATMDVGCYTVHLLRHLIGEEPEVLDARATMMSEHVDRAMTATLRFPGGASGKVTCSLLSRRVLSIGARVRGSRGTLSVFNPTGPQYGPHHVRVRTRDGARRREQFTRLPTYQFQLAAFTGAVLEGREVPTGPEDAIANMRVIDAIYRAAGLRVRDRGSP